MVHVCRIPSLSQYGAREREQRNEIGIFANGDTNKTIVFLRVRFQITASYIRVAFAADQSWIALVQRAAVFY